jgi:hypothetical protein
MEDLDAMARTILLRYGVDSLMHSFRFASNVRRTYGSKMEASFVYASMKAENEPTYDDIVTVIRAWTAHKNSFDFVADTPPK